MAFSQVNGTWSYPWGSNPRGPYGGTPPDMMHTFLAGLIKYLVLWLLGLIRFVPGFNQSGKTALNKLDTRFKFVLSRSSDRRLRIKKFSGAAFILGSSTTTRGKVNSCGGFMTSSEWVPMLIALLVIVMDESLGESGDVLAREHHVPFINAANLTINLCLWIKSGRFEVGMLTELGCLVER